MTKREFMSGTDVKYVPDSVITLNGERGRVWTCWRKTAEGSWLHTGKQFAGERETRKAIAMRFGNDYAKE